MSSRRAASVGIISDTHGLVRPEALAAMKGADLILHAGDVGAPNVLEKLAEIAPLHAVRGNNDRGAWARCLPSTETVTLGDVRLLVVHDRSELDGDPRSAGFHVVVSGHSHRPSIEKRDRVLWLNPGSAGPRRFHLPVSVARLVVDGEAVRAKIVILDVATARPQRK